MVIFGINWNKYFFWLWTLWFLVYTCTWTATCCFVVNLIHGTCYFWYIFEMLSHTLNMVFGFLILVSAWTTTFCLFANIAIFGVDLNCYLLFLCEHSDRWSLSSYVAFLWTLKKYSLLNFSILTCLSAEYQEIKICSHSSVMVTSPHEWKFWKGTRRSDNPPPPSILYPLKVNWLIILPQMTNNEPLSNCLQNEVKQLARILDSSTCKLEQKCYTNSMYMYPSSRPPSK